MLSTRGSCLLFYGKLDPQAIDGFLDHAIWCENDANFDAYSWRYRHVLGFYFNFVLSIEQSSFLVLNKQHTKVLVSAPYFSLHIIINIHTKQSVYSMQRFGGYYDRQQQSYQYMLSHKNL